MLRTKQAGRHGSARRLGMQRIPECTLCVLVCWMKTQAAACMANPGWEMQHLFILQENGWSGGASDVTMASYAELAKRLSILHKLSGGTGSGGTSDGPFGNGRVFGDQGFERKRSLGSPNVEKLACYKCGGAHWENMHQAPLPLPREQPQRRWSWTQNVPPLWAAWPRGSGVRQREAGVRGSAHAGLASETIAGSPLPTSLKETLKKQLRSRRYI